MRIFCSLRNRFFFVALSPRSLWFLHFIQNGPTHNQNLQHRMFFTGGFPQYVFLSFFAGAYGLNVWPVAHKLISTAALKFLGFVMCIKRRSSTVTTDELKTIQDLINYRPCKRLAFKTQHEVFHPSLKRDELRTRIYVILIALDQVLRL